VDSNSKKEGKNADTPLLLEENRSSKGRFICRDWPFAVIFLLIFGYVIKLGYTGIDEVLNTPICDLVTTADNSSIPPEVDQFYDHCLSAVILGKDSSKSDCLTYSVEVLEGGGDGRHRYLASTLSTNEQTASPVVSSSDSSLLHGLYQNCLQSKDTSTCANYAIEYLLGNSNSTQAFLTDCWDPLYTSESGFSESCAAYTINQVSSGAGDIYELCESQASSYTSTAIYNQKMLSCLKGFLPSEIGDDVTQELTTQCLDGVYGNTSMTLTDAALSCATYEFDQVTSLPSALTSTIVNSCLAPFTSCGTSTCDATEIIQSCVYNVLSAEFDISELVKLFESAVSIVFESAGVTTTASDDQCLSEILEEPLSSIDCAISLADTFLGLARLVCEELFKHEGVGGVLLLVGDSLWMQMLVYKEELIALIILSCGLAVGGAFAFLTLLTRAAQTLVKWTILGSLTLMGITCLLNFLFGLIPTALFLLVGLIIKIFWLICIWKDLKFVVECLVTASYAIRSLPSTIIVGIIAIIAEPVWLLFFFGASYSISKVAFAYDEIILVLAFFWTEAVIRGALAMIIIGILLAWAGTSIEDSKSWIWKWTTPCSSSSTSWKSVVRTFTEHFGSLCFGSFVLAALSTARYLVKKSQKGSLLKCCGVCLCCLKYLIQSLDQFNIDAYVLVVVQNLSYLQSCKSTAKLLVENQLVMVSISMEHTIGEVLGVCQSAVSFIVAGIVGGVCIFHMRLPFYLTLIVIITAYIIGFVVMSSARTGVDIGMKAIMMNFLFNPDGLIKEHPEFHERLMEVWGKRHADVPLFARQKGKIHTHKSVV